MFLRESCFDKEKTYVIETGSTFQCPRYKIEITKKDYVIDLRNPKNEVNASHF